MATDPLRSARSPPIFGRGQLLELAAGYLVEAAHGEGRFVALEGADGIGKSTLLEAVVERARPMGFRCLVARTQRSDLPTPYGLVRSLLETSGRPGDAAPEGGGPGTLVPMFLMPLGSGAERPSATLPPVGPAGEADDLLTRLSDPGDRLRGERRGLHERLVDFFREIAETQPLLLALDDLHHADRSSLDFLGNLLHHLTSERIAVVATLAPAGELAVETAGAVEGLLRLPLARALVVPPLTELDLRQYVRWLSGGRDAGADAVRRYFTQTGGNPLYVENLVRAQAGRGGVVPEGSGDDLRSLLEARVKGLTEGERRTLVYGAVLGRAFDFALLARATGAPEESLTEALDRLVQAGLLRERAGEVYEFVSERVRADVYGELTETRRGILHRKALKAVEGTTAPPGPDLFEMARHAYLGHDDARSSELNRRAAESAAESLAFDAAAAMLDRALESQRHIQPPDPARELRLEVELGRLLAEAGDLKRAEAVLEEAVLEAHRAPTRDREQAAALLGLARVRADRVDLRSALSLANEAFEILHRLNDARGLMAAHRVLGATTYRLGQLDAAERHQRAELELAEVHGTPAEQGHALIDLANTFISRGPARLQEALGLFDRAAQIFAGRQDPAAEARVRMNRGLLYHNSGRMEEALADLVEAASAAELSGSRIWIGYTQLNLAQVRAELHDPAAARRALDRALGLLEPMGDRLITQSSKMILGIIAEEEGNLPGAEAQYREAVELAREMSLGPDASESLFRLARVVARAGDRVEAAARLQEAFDLGLLEQRADLRQLAEALAQELGLALPPSRS